jgi:hypothetical protein
MKYYILKSQDADPQTKMNAVEAKERKENGDYSEAARVDEEYEHLLKNKDQGITFEEYCRRRGIKL